MRHFAPFRTSRVSNATLVSALALVGCGGDDAVPEPEPRTADFPEMMQDPDLVYAVQRVIESDGEVSSWQEIGEWTDDLFQRTARPWLYVAEGVVYDSHAWVEEVEDGTTLSGLAVFAHAAGEVTSTNQPVKRGVDPDLSALIGEVSADALLPVMIEVQRSAFPIVPLLPLKSQMSADEYELALQNRATLYANDAALFHEEAANVIALIESSGGDVVAEFSDIGWISALLPAASIDAVAAHSDALAVRSEGHGNDGACGNDDCATWPDAFEPMGDAVSLSLLRIHSGAEAFIVNGFDGQPAVNQEVLIGINESYGLKEAACFQADGANCSVSARMRKLFDCQSGSCTFGSSGFGGSFSPFRHGTIVSAIAMGDYNDSQGAGLEGQIAPGLPAGWRYSASGFGQEAEAHYFSSGDYETGKVAAYSCARAAGPHFQCTPAMDIVTASNALPQGVCSATSWMPIEAAVENAFDDGLLPVVLTHNDNFVTCGTDSCKVRSPADIPKAFAVGALAPDENAPYESWPWANYSNRGGGPVLIGGIQLNNAMTMVDLVASGMPGYVTYPDGNYGEVRPDGPCHLDSGLWHKRAGTSYAAPQVAGAAALLRHRLISAGATWIGFPGALHVAMLAMGDRATNTALNGATLPLCVSGSRILCGADRYYGLGRLKLRLHNLYSHSSFTFTTGGSNPAPFMPFGTKHLLTNHVIVKCVMQQSEDMVSGTGGTGKADISRIKIELKLRERSHAGTCIAGAGNVVLTRYDDFSDDKHMVAILDSEVDLNQRCPEVTLTKNTVSSAGSVSTRTYCYVDDQLDY